MSMVHTGQMPVLHTNAASVATAFASTLRRLFLRAPRVHEHVEPAQMTRERLAEELLSPCLGLSKADVREAAYFGISAPRGTDAEMELSRRLAIARELLCRDLRHHLQDATVMESPHLLSDWLKMHCAGLDYEVFFVAYLSTQHRVIAIEPMFRGTLTQTSVYPREVVKGALLHRAAAVAVAHNHPMGDPQPSRADLLLTATLKTALAHVDVRLMDHMVIAGQAHYSFAEHGDL